MKRVRGLWFFCPLLGYLLTAPAYATVTFDFYETAITSCITAMCFPQTTPLAVLTISDPTGSASLDNNRQTLSVSDPAFTFGFDPGGGFLAPAISPATDYGFEPGCESPPSWGCEILGYSASWAATDGVLTYLDLWFTDDSTSMRFETAGGAVSSDNEWFFGCGECAFSGVWQDPPQDVPEPGTLVLLTLPMLALAFTKSSRLRRRVSAAGLRRTRR